jgi:hypothetical protein
MYAVTNTHSANARARATDGGIARRSCDVN